MMAVQAFAYSPTASLSVKSVGDGDTTCRQ
jgi:hypothetical protein